MSNGLNDQDQTVPAAGRPPEADSRACPFCGAANALALLQRNGYQCCECRRELAHLDTALNGTVRGVFGWLLAPGEIVLERFQIKSVLGKGGFGAAYLVDDLHLKGKRRALKEVPGEMFDEYESSLLSLLDHPAIPDIIERRTVGNMAYLVLKFGGNRTLGSERKGYPGQRVPLEKLLPWMRQLCEVLIYLHAQTPPIVHRDLKPDNVLLDENDRIMLIDFGIAKEAVPESMTRTLGRAASLYFSPPEQVMGTGTDQRADIYALGATFYALLTGQNPPAAHERVAGKALAPPSELVPGLDPRLEQAILQALSLNMNQRQQTMREFALALDLEAGGTPPPPPGPQEPRTLLAGRDLLPSHSALSQGLKLTTERVSGALPNPVSTTGPAPWPAWLWPVAAGATLAAVLGGWLYFREEAKAPASPPPQAQPIAPTVPPTVSPAPEPAQPATIPPGSAQEALKSRTPPPPPKAEPPVAEPAAAPAQPHPSPTPKPRPVPKPPPKPRPVQAPVRTPSRSPPPAGNGGGWVIIPGGAHKTD